MLKKKNWCKSKSLANCTFTEGIILERLVNPR